jgi:hypothetical protein
MGIGKKNMPKPQVAKMCVSTLLPPVESNEGNALISGCTKSNWTYAEVSGALTAKGLVKLSLAPSLLDQDWECRIIKQLLKKK